MMGFLGAISKFPCKGCSIKTAKARMYEKMPHSPRVGQRCPMQTLCGAHRAPACKSRRGHRGCVALLLHAPSTTTGTLDWCQEGGARERTLFGLGGLCAPKRTAQSDDDNGEGASQGLGAALAPTGRSGGPRRGHGRVEGAET